MGGATGVEPRGQSIRITFKYLGARRRETLKIPPTKPNLKYAERKRARILLEIEDGSFNYAAHFPESNNASLGRSHDARTIADFHAIWLSTLNLERSTKRGYEGSYSRYIEPQFGERDIQSVALSELKAWRARLIEQYAPKTVNNAQIVMRGIMSVAYGDESIRRDLAQHLTNVTIATDKSHVDPFEMHEIWQIADKLLERGQHQERNTLLFGFSAGLRPGELMALHWSDIDWPNQRIRVQRNWVMKDNKSTKTRRIRDVDMLGHAEQALKDQRGHTGMSGDLVFPDPRTGRQYERDDSLRTYFMRWCTLAGVRPRPPKQMRHTYGSMMLSTGEPPLYVMEQMGHTSLTMLERHYAKWMRSANTQAGSAFTRMAQG